MIAHQHENSRPSNFDNDEVFFISTMTRRAPEDVSSSRASVVSVDLNKSTKDQPDTLDSIFRDYGQFSRYQKLLLFLILLPCSIPCGLHQFDQVLMALPANHWCRVPSGVPLPVDVSMKVNANIDSL